MDDFTPTVLTPDQIRQMGQQLAKQSEAAELEARLNVISQRAARAAALAEIERLAKAREATEDVSREPDFLGMTHDERMAACVELCGNDAGRPR